MTVPLTIPTGKNNMLASLRKYLTEQLPNDKVVFEQYENVQEMPSISFEDVGIPGYGSHAFNDYIGQLVDEMTGVSQGNVYGKIAQTNVEFNCMANYEDDASAVQHVYQMHDRLEYLFMYAGRTDESGALILPRIDVLDFDADSNGAETGSYLWAPMERDSIWMPSFIGIDPEKPGIKRLRILCRINWYMLRP